VSARARHIRRGLLNRATVLLGPGRFLTPFQILRIQFAPYLFRLQRELNLTLHFVNGRLECPPHPSLAGVYSGKTYQNYSWDDDHGPPTEENKVAVKNAFEHVYSTIEEEGPFDGALGFSQGASCLTGMLLNHEREDRGSQADLFKFLMLFSTSGVPEWHGPPDGARIRIPSLHVCSQADTEWFEDSKAVAGRCEDGLAELLTHGAGHAVPKDRPTVDRVVQGMARLLDRVKDRCS
jgi:hypothetical protein